MKLRYAWVVVCVISLVGSLLSTCTPDFSTGESTCGDGVLEDGEVCDDGNRWSGDGCDDCRLEDGWLCTQEPSVCRPECGDAAVHGDEVCDGSALNGQTCADQGFYEGTLACAADCQGYDRTGCRLFLCEPQSTVIPEGRPALQSYSHPSVNLQIAVPIEALVQDVGPEDAAPGEAAVTFDRDQLGHETAGFAVARVPAGADAQEEVVEIINALASAGFATMTVRALGVSITSHDGHPSIANTELVVSSSLSQDLAQVRNTVVASLLGRATTLFIFPGFMGHAGSEFVISFATQIRSGSAMIMGAVALLSDFNSGAHVGINVEDAANSTGLAETTATRTGECQYEMLSRLPAADIIWVIDDSGSMLDERANVVNNAANFYNFAGTYSLDFRMGVLNMAQSGSGELCSAAGQSGDTFLTDSDLAEFQECVMEPWGSGQTANEEYGLTQGYNAIINHLPRADAPDRIRPDAHLAIVYVSDEAAQEVKDGCGGQTGPWDATCIAGLIAPTLGYLEGTAEPEGIGIAHAIAPLTPLGCAEEEAAGYLELAYATGGQVRTICSTDLGPAMLAVLQEVVAGASPVALAHVPISASLAVALEDKSASSSTLERLDRSRTYGFDYRVGSNGLIFIGHSFSELPYELVLSYERWQ